MRYAFVGVGALGGYYAAQLTRAGHEVHYLMRSDAEFVRSEGLKVDSIAGDFHVYPEHVYSDFRDMPKADVVCISLKATANRDLFPVVEHLSRSGGLVVVMQNGYGLEQQLQKDLPDRILVGALCFICAQKMGPGYVKHMDYGAVRFGALDPAEGQELLAELVADFAGAGVETHLLQNLELARWQKLMWNIPFNGLCTLLRVDTHALVAHPASLALVHALMREVQKGAQICGVEIPDAFLEKMIADTRKMTPYQPSMQVDWEAGRPLEWEAIYQLPLEAVRALGGDMPKVEALMYQLAFVSKSPAQELL